MCPTWCTNIGFSSTDCGNIVVMNFESETARNDAAQKEHYLIKLAKYLENQIKNYDVISTKKKLMMR